MERLHVRGIGILPDRLWLFGVSISISSTIMVLTSQIAQKYDLNILLMIYVARPVAEPGTRR
jgi:hypothetical protein